ncbi:galactose mutarotase [Streptomyces sp. J2-1]|uniref:aldose epimerase family protein n=1 Tax=Streptomyces corallincola TaxID=2851888 RepID=UPI001C392337|nr:aldose epimerase family protein [Streptomyces corallincola]MBV2353797.1 galactose mutarotase [Streptomyces corallincola]
MSELFGTLSDGSKVHRWTLERAGVRVRVLTYGGIVQSLEAPDRDGRVADVVLGFPELDGYVRHPEPYLGALVGRYANRVAGGRFPLVDRVYALARNAGPNSLHGGERGFDKRVWDAEPVEHGVRLHRVSPHGEEGFPGRLDVTATYTLLESGALRVAYAATTDAPTVVNLTNHSYWNLAGTGTTAAHRLRLSASRYTPVDANLIPLGGLEDVTGTGFDFRAARELGTTPYDHNYVLDGGAAPAAELYDPASGRTLTVTTSEPGLQLYTGDHLAPPHAPRSGVALETQHFPDSPNHPAFPTTELRPGERYASWTTYAPGWRN